MVAAEIQTPESARWTASGRRCVSEAAAHRVGGGTLIISRTRFTSGFSVVIACGVRTGDPNSMTS
jgi:hypothetical protein